MTLELELARFARSHIQGLAQDAEEDVDKVDTRKFSPQRLKALFKRFSAGGTKIEGDQFLELVDKLGYDITEVQALVLCFLLQVPAEVVATAPSVDEEMFIETLGDNGIDSLSKLKAKIKNGPGSMFWTTFYEYTFKLSRESPQHKYIDCETAISVLPLVYDVAPKGEYPQINKFVAYLEMMAGKTAESQGKVKAPNVSEDAWRELPKFLAQFRDDKFAAYDPMDPWPTIIDDMVEWAQGP